MRIGGFSISESMEQFKTGTVLHGQELDDHLFTGIEYNKSGLIAHLSQFNGNDLFHNWQ